MKDHKQEAGDNAQQYQAGGNIIIVQGVTEERAREIAEIASREVVLRESRAVAEVVITERTDQLTNRIFEGINQRDTTLFGRFGDPRFLAAFTSAQRSYAETGAEDLGLVLASLLVHLAAQPIRTTWEIILRQAIEIAPLLTSGHLKALAVNMYLTRFSFNQPYDTEMLIRSLDTVFRPYYGGLPKSSVDYSYMSSTGVGTYMDGLQDLGNKPYQLLHKRYPNSMYPAFTFGEMRETLLSDDNENRDENEKLLGVLVDSPEDVVQTEQGTVIKPEAARFRVAPDHVATVLGNRIPEQELTDAQKTLRSLIRQRSLSAEQFGDKIAELQPELADFLNHLESTSAMNFQLHPVGTLLGRHEIGDKVPHLAAQIDAAFDAL